MEAKIEKMQKLFIKDLEKVRNKQSKLNNALERISNRIRQKNG